MKFSVSNISNFTNRPLKWIVIWWKHKSLGRFLIVSAQSLVWCSWIQEKWYHNLITNGYPIAHNVGNVIPICDKIVVSFFLYPSAPHSAQQNITAMKTHANQSVYWPGMEDAEQNYRANHLVSSNNILSHPQEPIALTSSSERPFGIMVMDLFYVGHHAYIACADRLTGWLILYHLEPGQATLSWLISICQDLFCTYGTPEELSTNGGLSFTSDVFQQFLSIWGVRHRLSIVAHQQLNGHAELAIRVAKKIVYSLVGTHGSLDNDKANQAILQYHNTPIQGIGLSPAQLLHHQHCDWIPTLGALHKPNHVRVTDDQRWEGTLYRGNLSLPPLRIEDRAVIGNR